MDAECAALETAAVNRLLEAFSGLGAVIHCISDDLATLQRQASRNRLIFGDDGTLHGAMWLHSDNCCYMRDDDLLQFAVGACDQLPEWVQKLYEQQAEALTALNALPHRLRSLLDSLTAKPWAVAVRRDCLDWVIAWPGETLHPRALGSRKVCTRPDELLKAAAAFDPYQTWKAYQEKLHGYCNDLMALEGPLPPSAKVGDASTGDRAQTFDESSSLPEVNLDTNQVRYGGQCYDVTADGALLFSKLAESYPHAFSASRLFTKPSRVKSVLPDALKSLIVAVSGKGYRLKLD